MEGSRSIRPASVDDLPALVEIERKVHIAPWAEEHFQGELTKPYSQVLVLTDDETDSKIAAYIVYWLMFDECQILNVAVDFPYRGLGLGKQMIRAAIAAAVRKSTRRVVLDVRKSNQAAIQLYHGVGFVITQMRKSFYSNGEDAYQMTLYLEDQGVKF